MMVVHITKVRYEDITWHQIRYPPPLLVYIQVMIYTQHKLIATCVVIMSSSFSDCIDNTYYLQQS